MDRSRLRTLLAVCSTLCLLQIAADAADRVALIIGNGRYTKLRPLDACPRDAAKMADAFKKVGIRIHRDKPLVDLSADQMDKALNEFVKTLGPDSEAFVYFSGHGAQIGGTNYLLPVGFDAEYESQARRQAVSLDAILELLERTPSKLRILILDACRDAGDLLPGEPALKSTGRTKGLSEQKVDAPETLVCFATKHGSSALAGTTGSPYTDVLAEEIVKSGEIGAIMRTVARRVYEATDKRQLPFTYGSLLQDHFFAVHAPAGLPPEEYHLKNFVLKTGQALKRESELGMPEATVTMTMPGGSFKGSMSLNNRGVEMIKILAASNGQPTEVEIEFKECTEKQALNLAGQTRNDEKKAPLNGTTVLAKKVNGAWTTRLKKGTPTPEQKKELLKVGSFESDNMYEDRAMAVGASWNVTPERVPGLMGGAMTGDATGTVQCKFDRVETYNSHPCAVIAVEMKVTGKSPEPNLSELTMTVEMKGTIFRSLEEKIDLKTELSGTVRMDGPVPGSPGTRMEMIGPMSLKHATIFVK